MSVPKYYLEKLNDVNSFNKLLYLKGYLNCLNEVKSQKIINFEKSVFVLSGMEISNFSLDEIDLSELETYIDSRLHSSNKHLDLLYGIAHIHVKLKLKKDLQEIPTLLDKWFEQLDACRVSYSSKDSASYVTIFLVTYLQISKQVSGKKFDKKLLNVLNFMMGFKVLEDVFAHLCNDELLSFFSKDAKREIINYFFSALIKKINICPLEQKTDVFTVGGVSMAFFKNSIELCHKYEIKKLQNEITEYVIDRSFKYVLVNPSVENLSKIISLNLLFELSTSEVVKNKILLKLIDTSKNTYKSMINSSKLSKMQFSEDVESRFDKENDNYKKYSTSEGLLKISEDFFGIAKTSNSVSNSRIAIPIIFDQSGLLIGSAGEDEDFNLFELTKCIHVYIQIIFQAYQIVAQKPNFQEYLSNIELFRTEDDKHIRKAFNDFIQEDYYGFVCRSIPLIEKKLRLILRELGEADIKKNDIGGFDFRPMNAFMSSDLVNNTFGKDIVFMLKAIFDDRRGFNLRNKVAHGIIEANEITLFHGLLVLFTIVYLSNIRAK